MVSNISFSYFNAKNPAPALVSNVPLSTSYEDAIAIKLYNGDADLPYMSWSSSLTAWVAVRLDRNPQVGGICYENVVLHTAIP